MFKPISQYEVNHMENLMVRDDYWDRRENDRTEIVNYCEIYDCRDCPKCGDTCDGLDMEEDDEFEE